MNQSLQDFFKEYERKLIKLYDRFYTDAAKEMAKNGRSVMELFHDELMDQLNQTEAQNWLKSVKSR